MNKLSQRQKILLFIGVAVLLLLGQQYQRRQLPSEPIPTDIMLEEDAEPLQQEIIYVHVTGAVEKPGVYPLEQGQRIEDALLLAGVAVEADIELLNRAAIVTDGQKIVVPAVLAEGETANNQGVMLDDGKVSVNEATLQELITLPGIGEAKGQAIIDYRLKHGGFSALEDLCKVPGIGQATYNKLADQIKL